MMRIGAQMAGRWPGEFPLGIASIPRHSHNDELD